MILTRDLSRHQANIKSSLIPTSASSFLCHDYNRVVHLLRLHYVHILVSSSLQHASSTYCGRWAGTWWSSRKTTSRFQWWWRERRFSSIAINESHWEITSRSTPIPIPVLVAWEGVPSIAINESHWWEPQWVMSRTASWTQHKPNFRGRQYQLQPSTILLNE